MQKEKLTAEERCALICRVADWVADNTETWSPDDIGLGLAYLFWSIAEAKTYTGFSADPAQVGTMYGSLIVILKANPNGLWQTLVDGGFVEE